MLYWIRVSMLFHFKGDAIGISHTALWTFLICSSALFVMAGWGLWRQAYWSGGRFLLGLLPTLPMLGIAFFLLMGDSWLFIFVLPAEIFLYLMVLYYLAKIPKEYWKEKPQGWRKWLRFDRLVVLLFLLSATEFGLNIYGLHPGQIFPFPYFKKVDHLVLWQDYTADEYGITKLSPKGAELAANGNWNGKPIQGYHQNLPFSASSWSLFEDWQELQKGEGEGAFAEYIQELQGRAPEQLDSVDRAHLIYLERPINADGFRSIPFVRYPKGRKSVLLIGDSFTFGWSARPWTLSFADHLRTLGYVVYNAGITATGPEQYEAVARRYVPALKPDFVVVNFFMGNDILHYQKTALPNEMAYFPTNAGVMMAQPAQERLPDMETAYQFMVHEHYINEEGWFNQLCAQSVLGTMLWKLLRRFGAAQFGIHPDNKAYWDRNKEFYSEKPVSEDYLARIEDLCEEQGSSFLLGIIPEVKDFEPDLEEDYAGLFEQTDAHVLKVDANDYNMAEEHFNAQGHERYALMLDSLMQAVRRP